MARLGAKAARERRERQRGGVLFVLREIREAMPTDAKNAQAIRNQCTLEGRCPSCGATGELTADPSHERVSWLRYWHEHWCPAVEDAA